MPQNIKNSSSKSEFEKSTELNTLTINNVPDSISDSSRNAVNEIFENEKVQEHVGKDAFQVASVLENIIKKYQLGDFGFDLRAGKTIFRCENQSENNSKEIVEGLFKKTLSDILQRESFCVNRHDKATSMIFR